MTPPLFRPNFEGVPVATDSPCWGQLWNYFRRIPTYVITVPKRYRQTDKQTIYRGITALCVASCGKKNNIIGNAVYNQCRKLLNLIKSLRGGQSTTQHFLKFLPTSTFWQRFKFDREKYNRGMVAKNGDIFPPRSLSSSCQKLTFQYYYSTGNHCPTDNQVFVSWLTSVISWSSTEK